MNVLSVAARSSTSRAIQHDNSAPPHVRRHAHPSPRAQDAQPFAMRRFLERECGRPLDADTECNASDLVLRLDALGLGIAFIPDSVPQSEVEACGLRRVSFLGGSVTRRVVAIWEDGSG